MVASDQIRETPSLSGSWRRRRGEGGERGERGERERREREREEREREREMCVAVVVVAAVAAVKGDLLLLSPLLLLLLLREVARQMGCQVAHTRLWQCERKERGDSWSQHKEKLVRWWCFW